jgi:hypothetical protein
MYMVQFFWEEKLIKNNIFLGRKINKNNIFPGRQEKAQLYVLLHQPVDSVLKFIILDIHLVLRLCRVVLFIINLF